MAETAKLSANHFVAPGFNWRKPNWNKRAWDRIPPDAHSRQKVIVDYVLGGQFSDYRTIHWDMKFATGHDVVLTGGIIRIETQRICVAHKTDIAPAKLAIRSGQVIVETKLLRHDVNKQRVFAWRKLIHTSCPKRNSKAEEEHRFDQDNGEFQMG